MCLSQHLGFFFRDGDIRHSNGHTRFHGILEADILDAVSDLSGHIFAAKFINISDQVLDARLLESAVGELHHLGQNAVEQNTASSGMNSLPGGFGHALILLIEVGLHVDSNVGMDIHLPQLVSQIHFVDIREVAAVTLMRAIILFSQIIDTQNHILRRADDWFSIGRFQEVLGGKHQSTGLTDSFFRQRHMHSHLVTIKVRVESGRHQRMQLNGATLDQNRLEGLNAQTVQGWRTVQQDRTIFDDLFEHLINLGAITFDEAACTLDVGRVTAGDQTGDDERAEQFQRHRLR